MSTHSEIQSLLAPYALHALDDSDRELVDAHLATCHECSDELADLLETASMVTLTEVEAPPAQLWGRIATGMRADQLSSPVTAPVAAPVSAPVSAPVAAVERNPVTDLGTERLRRRGIRNALLGAVAAVAVAVPITASVVQPATPSIAALATKAAASTNARKIALLSPEKTRLGEVILDANGNGYLTNETLSPLPEGQSYQLWTIVNGVPVSAGLLGRTPTTVAFSAAAKVDAVAVTIELDTGASAPTATPLGVAVLE
jgi:lipoprotein-anchoring transpeptidase ErfK/SrfK